MTEYHVYELTRSDGEIFYIGQTARPVERLAAHRSKFGRNVYMKIVATFDCRMEAKWEERERMDITFGLGNYRSNVLSQVLYPRRCGSPKVAKQEFLSEVIAYRGRVPDITVFGWDHYGYPTSSIRRAEKKAGIR